MTIQFYDINTHAEAANKYRERNRKPIFRKCFTTERVSQLHGESNQKRQIKNKERDNNIIIIDFYAI